MLENTTPRVMFLQAFRSNSELANVKQSGTFDVLERQEDCSTFLSIGRRRSNTQKTIFHGRSSMRPVIAVLCVTLSLRCDRRIFDKLRVILLEQGTVYAIQ